jgi:hypothetical protein
MTMPLSVPRRVPFNVLRDKERKERRRQELRSSILAAAREIASTEGWRSVTIRRIAERIEYRTAGALRVLRL